MPSPMGYLKPLSHLTGLAKWMETEQSLLKYVNVCFLYGYHSLYTLHAHCISAEVRQIFCSISCPNNNTQEYLLSGSVCNSNLVRCDRALYRWAERSVSQHDWSIRSWGLQHTGMVSTKAQYKPIAQYSAYSSLLPHNSHIVTLLSCCMHIYMPYLARTWPFFLYLSW